MKLNILKSIITAVSIALATTGNGKIIPNYPVANLVLGQADFTSSTPPGVTASSLFFPSGVVVDPTTRKVFVVDIYNNRVLRYSSADTLTNGAPAEAVFGQASFATADAPLIPNPQSMNGPRALFFDHLGRLWVTDTLNHRVLRFSAASYISSQTGADRVYGQATFTTSAPSTTATGMNTPIGGVWVDSSDRLWVGDSGNNRVLRFDTITNKASGSAATAVLGHINFLVGTPGSGASGMQSPSGIAVSENGALFVACFDGNRVMRFDNAATLSNGASANIVLGQTNFTSTGFGLSDTQMHSPAGLTITQDDSLWVCDYDNHRVIRFNQASSKLSGSLANGIVGQPNFTTRSENTTAQGLRGPSYSPFVDTTGSLWVPDAFNNRILRFAAIDEVAPPPPAPPRPKDTVVPTISVIGKVAKTTTKNKVSVTGEASDEYGIASVQFRVNTGSLQYAIGTTAWQIKAKLKKGKNTITIYATDTAANISRSQVIKIRRN